MRNKLTILSAIFAVLLLGTTTAHAKKRLSTPTVKLTEDNTIALNGPVDDSSVQAVQLKAKKLDLSLKSGYPIYLVLNTPGGEIQAGLELIEFLNSLNRPVHTVTLFAASMGWQIAQHLGNRYILNYGVLMSHKASGGFQGEFPGQIDSRYGFWLGRINQMDTQTVKRTKGKQSLKSYRAQYENELWLGGPDAVKKGYANKVVKMSCSKELSLSNEEVKVSTFFGSVVLTFSGCPSITGPTGMSAKLRTNQGLMTLGDFNAKGGTFITDNRNTYSDLYALDTKVNQELILEEFKKHEYKFNNKSAVIKGY